MIQRVPRRVLRAVLASAALISLALLWFLPCGAEQRPEISAGSVELQPQASSPAALAAPPALPAPAPERRESATPGACRVLWPNGLPATGARIVTTDTSGETKFVCRVDDEGVVVVEEVTAGAIYRARWSKGHVWSSQTATADEVLRGREFILEELEEIGTRTAALAGVVTCSDGRPVPAGVSICSRGRPGQSGDWFPVKPGSGGFFIPSTRSGSRAPRLAVESWDLYVRVQQGLNAELTGIPVAGPVIEGLRIVLEIPPSFGGMVVRADEPSTPLEGIRINFEDRELIGSHGPAQGFCVTKSDGRFEFFLRSDRFPQELEVKEPGYAQWKTPEGAEARMVEGAEFVVALQPEAVLSGTILDDAAEPAPERMVLLSYEGEGPYHYIPSAETDREGRFSFRSLNAGPYQLRVCLHGGHNVDVHTRIALAVGEHQEISLRLPTLHSISGRLVASGGSSKWTVTFASDEGPSSSATAAADGTFQLKTPACASGWLTAWRTRRHESPARESDYAAYPLAITPPAQDLVLEVIDTSVEFHNPPPSDEAPQLDILFSGDVWHRFSGHEISLCPRSGGRDRKSRLVYDFPRAMRGLPPGGYTLIFREEGGREWRRPVEIAVGTPVTVDLAAALLAAQ